jgi:branched-chain amino acid aminotransferase
MSANPNTAAPLTKLPPNEWIWKNGEFIPWGDANVHILAHSMQFGSAAFEGVRCYKTPNGPAVFRLEDHLTRLINSCKIYRMEVKYSIDDMVAATCELVDRNKMEACYIRPMVLRGFGASGMVPFGSPVEAYIPCWKWGSYHGDSAMNDGVDACVASWARMAPNTTPAGAKVGGNYLSSQLIKMEALQNGFDEGIALDVNGRLSEGSGQNLFLVSKGTILTAPINGTLLPGITRDTVMTFAREQNIPVREIELPRESIYTADEVFMTGTAAEVTPVRSVDRLPIGTGKPGPVTQQIQRSYMQTVKGEIDDTHGWLTYVKAEKASRA